MSILAPATRRGGGGGGGSCCSDSVTARSLPCQRLPAKVVRHRAAWPPRDTTGTQLPSAVHSPANRQLPSVPTQPSKSPAFLWLCLQHLLPWADSKPPGSRDPGQSHFISTRPGPQPVQWGRSPQPAAPPAQPQMAGGEGWGSVYKCSMCPPVGK